MFHSSSAHAVTLLRRLEVHCSLNRFFYSRFVHQMALLLRSFKNIGGNTPASQWGIIIRKRKKKTKLHSEAPLWVISLACVRLLCLHLSFWHCVIPMAFSGVASYFHWGRLRVYVAKITWALGLRVNFPEKDLRWGNRRHCLHCLLVWRAPKLLLHLEATQRVNRNLRRERRDVSCPLTEQLICGTGNTFSRYCRTKLGTTASLRIFYCLFVLFPPV